MIDNLEFLIDQKQVELFFNENSEKIFNGNFIIKVLKIKRSDTYNPDSYNVLYKLLINNKPGEIRASASKIRSINKETEFNIIKYFYTNGFDKGDMLVTKPLAYLDEFNLMFYENIEGRVLLNDLNSNADLLKQKIKKCSLLLKKVHTLKRPDFPLWNSDSLFTFQSFEKTALKKYYPELEEKLEEIILKIKSKTDQIKSSDFCHGDFQPTNIIFSNKKTYILDFGLTTLLDKEYDIATFINQLRVMTKRFGNFEYFEELKNIFLETYGEFNLNKFNHYALLINLRILITFCVSQGKEDNLNYMPLVYDLVKKDLEKI